jgi:ABC-2 type transport system permease protein
MGLAETDFSTYVNFQNQAESYRYQLAQKMNELQIQLISNKKQGKSDKPYVISKTHWHEMPDFIYQQQSFGSLLNNQLLTITALLFWLIVSAFMVIISSKNSNAF